jgi:monothiol glutaredoxin
MTEFNVIDENEIKKSKSRENGNSIHEELESMIQENEILLFMKGNRLMPQCGFSAHVVGLLEQHRQDYVTFDVLSDQEVRQGIKEFSNWPTIPQLYVNGKFVGGCDIVTEMAEEGELEELLKS